MSESKLLGILNRYWGYNSFREGQLDIINAVVDRKDTLALLPTGGGKSICYQIPALYLDGVTIVISPLIALMNDQVERLKAIGVKVEVVHSAMNKYQIDTALDNCVYGKVKLLYLSPERLSSELLITRVKKMDVSLIAVDEAHCISEWGYDFRPSYLKISDFREVVGVDVPVIALTATATPKVAKDIQEKLRFAKTSQFFQKTYFRENLGYVVVKEASKLPYLFDLIDKIKGTSIIYVRSRKQTAEITKQLIDKRIPATYYHAGLSYEARNKNQALWIEGKVKIMVATNAFGMGIDKSDVQLIVHLDLPDSLEAYFQEAGRAGRDGAKSFAVLLWNDGDVKKLNEFHEMSFPSIQFIKSVYSALGSYFKLAVGSGKDEVFNFEVFDFSKKFKLEPLKVIYALKFLVQNELLYLTDKVFSSATIMVICSRDVLYDYQIRHKKFNIVLKALLRYAEGVFVSKIRINEAKFADFVEVPKDEVIAIFNHLHRDEIIDYSGSTFEPRMTFLTERLNPEGLNLDVKSYRIQKERKKLKIESITKYVNEDDCRSQLLLDYFGEKSDLLCGRCDYCRKQNKEKKDTSKIQEQIKFILFNNPTSFDDLLAKFDKSTHGYVLDTIDFLIGESIIKKENKFLIWDEK